LTRPSPEELADTTRYHLFLEIKHTELAQEVSKLVRQPSLLTRGFAIVNVLLLIALGLVWIRSQRSLISAGPNLCLGMGLGWIILIPIHERVHYWTHRWLGARDCVIVYDWRRLTAYCAANRFVAGVREFLVIALSPFAAINTSLIVLIAAFGGFRPILWGMLLFHSVACVGDFALAGLAWRHRRRGLMTYDDLAAGVTYFFEENPAQPSASQGFQSAGASST